MNYGELKHNLISKGFAEESDYEEFEELGYTYDAINQALDEISDWFPVEAEFDFDIDESDTGIFTIDMADRAGFVSLAESPVQFESAGQEVWRAFSEYEIKMNRKIIIKVDDYEGSFRIYYNKLPAHVDESTADDFEFDLPLAAHKLIPHLAAYYLWLDDDYQKATIYRNDFEDARNTVMARQSKPMAQVRVSEWGDI